MTRTRCGEIEVVIDREVHGLNEHERLLLEEHVGRCVGCRDTLLMSRMVRETFQRATPRLTDSVRLRVLDRALDAGSAARAAPLQLPRARWLTGAVGVAALAAAGLLIGPLLLTDAKQPTAQAPKVQPVTAQPASARPAPSAGALAHVPTWVESAETEARTFGAAQVKLAAATRVHFDETTRTLALARGRIDVDARGERSPLTITTGEFRIETLGAQFVVTPDSVEVVQGTLRVFDLEDKKLVKEVSAGASFDLAPEPAPHEAHAPVPGRVWLARARKAVAAGDVADGRAHLARAERAQLVHAERGEAATLRAEIALLEQNPRAALGLYEKVARNFAELRAGENAAYAAAQLARRAAPARERTLLRGYLTRYPQGRFAREAKQRLDQL